MDEVGVTLVVFLGMLTVLVTAHELGHFMVARVAGIRVQEFGFGYPPRIGAIERGGTAYSINLLPLGGFVRMLGETGDGEEVGSFASQSKVARSAVLMAGSAMNLLLAPVCLTVALMLGEMVPCEGCGRVQVYSVQSGTASESAGLRDGDIFQSINGRPISQASDVRSAVQESSGQALGLRLLRSGTVVEVSVTPRKNATGVLALGIGLGPEYVLERRPLAEAVPIGLLRTGSMAVNLVTGLTKAFAPESPVQLAGPVGIAEMTGRAARAGTPTFLQFMAFLSLNLAIFNMLPVPGLDGARLLFVGIELVRGRRVSPRVEGAVHLAGMALLLALMLIVSFRDIQRLVAS